MSAFSISPRPRIVNSVLIKECNDKRHNGLQGTNSKEDFYRAIVEMPSPTLETDIQSTEATTAASDLHFNRSPRQKCPHFENINGPIDFAQKRKTIPDQAETYSAGCDHRRAFESEECEQQAPPFRTRSNSGNYSTSVKLDMEEKQDTLDSEVCCEGKDLMYKGEWESGDHHRPTVDSSSVNKEDSSALYEANYHHTPDSYCSNTPVTHNKTKPKYPCKKNSETFVGGDSVLEECHKNINRQANPVIQDTVLTEDKPVHKIHNSTRLQEHTFDSSHGNTEDRHVSMKSEHCYPQNALHEALPRVKKMATCYERYENLVHPHTSSPEHIHRTPQVCGHQDEQSERSEATGREELCITEDHHEEFVGYPPQRATNFKQSNVYVEDENFCSHGNLNAKTLANKKQECRRFIRRKCQMANITEQEARSVAELLSHPVLEVHPVESEILSPPCSPPLRTQNSGEVQGYPPQPVTSGRLKYSTHRTYENDLQNEETHNYDCNAHKKKVGEHYDYSGLNDSSFCSRGEHEQRCAGQKSYVQCGNDHEGHEESCRAVFHHPHTTENECEEILPPGSVQHTHCVKPEQYNLNDCKKRSSRTFHPEIHEKHYHSHHSSNTPAEEINHLSVKKLSREAKCHPPVGSEGHESRFNHQDENLNEINSCRNNKELYESSIPSSYRPAAACYKDGSYRKENENVFCTPGYQHNENPTSSSVEHGDAHLESYENVSGEDEHALQGSVSHYKLQAERQGECYAQSARIPARSYNYFESERIGEKPLPRASEIDSKATSPCHENELGDNTVSCLTEQLHSPDRDSFGMSGLNERCVAVPYRRYNGLEDEDNEKRNALNGEESFEDEPSVPRKHRMLILQDARKNTTSQNKCETSPKVYHACSKARASEERIHPSNLTSKTRIPKLKTNMSLTSNKSNTTDGNLQRPRRAATQKS